MSRWQKNSCTRDEKLGAGLSLIEYPCLAFEPLGGESHEVGDSREVPVRVRHPRVAQVGGEGSELGVDVDAFAVPRQQTPTGEGVAQVVDPRQPSAAPLVPAQLPPENDKGLADLLVRQARGRIGDEEGIRWPSQAEAPIAMRGISGQR